MIAKQDGKTVFLIGDGTVNRLNPNIKNPVSQWRFPGRVSHLRRDFEIPHIGGTFSSRDHNKCTTTGRPTAGLKPYNAVWAFGLWILQP